MSTFAEKKALKVKHAAAVKKHGAKSQAAGRIQYKLNNLTSNPKGNAVKTTNGGTVTTAKGTVRTTPNPNRTTGKRIISKGIARPEKTGGHPSATNKVIKPKVVTPTKVTPTAKVVNKKVVNKGKPHRGNNAGTENPNLGGSVVRKRNQSIKKKGPDLYKEAIALDAKKKVGNARTTGAPHAKIIKSASPATNTFPKFTFSLKEDYSKVPRITGKLPAVKNQSKRQQLEAFRRRTGK